ncbi:MAG: glycoside hydrolase family 97 catalytic domain-containing protein, partial [Acidobacteriia bacterium]|nr:glycoside hydrolase family 97 catalytic domain-containing protein [Terriglobia bacterium]
VTKRADASTLSVVRQAPANSPWRVLMIADEPGRLVESNMVVNLNPPSAIRDTSWIKPGKTSWDWWSGSLGAGGGRGGMNTATMKLYIDFSARNGFPYMLIDAGWAGRAAAAPGAAGAGQGRGATDLTTTVRTSTCRNWSSTPNRRTSKSGSGPTGRTSTGRWPTPSLCGRSGVSPEPRSTSWTAPTNGW